MKTHSERGISIIIFVILLPTTLIAIAAAVNLGWLATAKNQAQTAVDAAALSAAAALPYYIQSNPPDSTPISAMARLFNGGANGSPANLIMASNPGILEGDLNSRDLALGHWTPDASPQFSPISDPALQARTNAVQITHKVYTPLFFARMLGITDDHELSVSATAAVDAPNCAVATAPVMLCENNPVFDGDPCKDTLCNRSFTVALQSGSTIDNSAWFSMCPVEVETTSKSQCDSASAEYFKRVINGESEARLLCSGSSINTNNGQVNDSLHVMKDVLQQKNSENELFEAFLPIVDCSVLNNLNDHTTVKAFAYVRITDINSHGNPKTFTFTRLCGKLLTGAPPGGKYCGVFSGPALVQ